MSTSKWTGAVSSNWDDANNWSPAGIPGVNSDVVIASGSPVASGPIGTVDSITDSSDLSFESAGANTVATFLDNTGFLGVDANGGEGGTILNIGETLTNSGTLRVGNTTLSASDEVTAAALDNSGTITLAGKKANRALLDVTAGVAGFGTAGVLSGYVELQGHSAIEFKSGQISTIATGATLFLFGNNAFIEDSKAHGSNSALHRLSNILGTFYLTNGASVSTTGALTNSDRVNLVGTGSTLSTAGALTNNGDVSIQDDTEQPERSMERGSSASTSLIFGSIRASRPGRPSTRAARTRSSSTRLSPSAARSAVSGPATRSTRRTFSSPERRSISPRIREAPARSRCTTGV
jgi:hypothetical protein